MNKPYVWQMIQEAMDHLQSPVSYSDIRNYINEKWGDVNKNTIIAQIIVLTVNHKSRIHYPENQKPRLSKADSKYDLLYYLGRGKVEKYNSILHGVWEIYQTTNNSLAIREYHEEKESKVYTPADIRWIKNVTNSEAGEAYLDLTKNIFPLHFPEKHKSNALSPKVGEIILLYQKVDSIPAFTHLVSPIDDELLDDAERPRFRYARRVKIIAKADKSNFIPVVDTSWRKLKFGGFTQGNACQLDHIAQIRNLDELKLEIWHFFSEYFIPTERKSFDVFETMLQSVDLDVPELSVNEGKLKLITHYIKERNPIIVREKKKQAIQNNILYCEVCSFSFKGTYDAEYIECHHINPISESNGEIETMLSDLALVCANCHRMLHKMHNNRYLTIEQLRERMISLRK